MEQDNKTMSAEELIRYIEDNHLEFQILDILLFNDCGFEFVPVYRPRIKPMVGKSGHTNFGIFDYDGINILGSHCQMTSFSMPAERMPKNWNKYINHPEHLHAYMFRYNNIIKGEFIYSRRSTVSAQIRNDAFESFIEYSGISNIKDFNKIARNAAKKRRKQCCDPSDVHKRFMNYINILFDESVINSLIYNHIDKDAFTNSFLPRLIEVEEAIYLNRYISVENMLLLTESGISFSMNFVLPVKNNTSLNQSFVIIDTNDHIPNILYQIAINISSNVFFAATGYIYDSGIQMLTPTLLSTRGYNNSPNIELIIGDLQNYSPDIKQKSMNRKTAESVNWLKDNYVLNHLYTCPDAFYHGKFYYISNGRISYVIVGSSNITESAYTKNRELDVMFRFERGEDGKPCEQEQMFLDWYADLKEKCVEIPRLDETLFSSNLLIDEAGNSSSSSILKKLTSEEERERYRFLESLRPSSVDEKMFYKKKEFKAFKGYIAFFYPENNITVLESFQYGNSCFVFGTTDEERIRMALARKSKEQVKQSDIYISNVNHDEDYQSELRQIFGK